MKEIANLPKGKIGIILSFGPQISVIIQVPFLLVYVIYDQLSLLLYILLIRGISSGLFIPVMVNFISSLLLSE